MGKRVFVGNLNYRTTKEALEAEFAEFGQVESCDVVTDRYTGKSRGFAFIEMATEAEAQAAVTGMNGKSVDGRDLRVEEAKPQRERSRDDRSRYRW